MSTTDALISFLQPIFEAIDKGDNIARIFFTDFSKGFDRVDHNVLMANLQKLNVPLLLVTGCLLFSQIECKQRVLPEYCLIGNPRMVEFHRELN